MKLPKSNRSKASIWGDTGRLEKLAIGLVVTNILMMLSPVDGMSFAAATSDGGEISREGFRQLEQLQRQQQGDLNHNMKMFMTSSSSSSSSGENAHDGPGGRGGVRRNDDDDEDVLEIMREEHVLPKTLQAAELLLEKYKQNIMEQEAAIKTEEEEEEAFQEEEQDREQQEMKHHHHHYRRPLAEPLSSPVALAQHHHQHQVQPILEAQPAVLMQMGRSASSGRSLDFEKRTSELCGKSASLECGKRTLSLIEGEEMSELSVHRKCDLRDDFLKCIDTKKRGCLEIATKSSVLPELPSSDDIKTERTKLWKVLWTAGGCVLAD